MPRPKRSADQPLTPADRAFADTWIATGDNYEALRAAGSSCKRSNAAGESWRRRQRPHIKAYIEKQQSKLEGRAIERAENNRESVHALIDESIHLARLGDPIIGKDSTPVYDEVWDEERGEYRREMVRRPNIPSMLKGAELKGKTIGMFTEVHRVEGEMEGKSQEELAAFLKGAASDEVVASILAEVPAVQRHVKRLLDRQEAVRQLEAGESEEDDPEPVTLQ